MNTQRKLKFGPIKETQVARCRRLLAGIPRVTTAAKLFDEAAHREAEQRCQAANRRIRENPVRLQETKST